MRAMILAAGRGERMGDLTRHTPKPLLRVGQHFLIEYAIANCKRARINDVVINVSYHAEQIKKELGDGKKYKINIEYSEEPQRLEVGGGILNALSLLGSQPFVVISSDVITNFPLKELSLKENILAHLVIVDNPYYHAEGDFGLQNEFINFDAKPKFTFSNIGLYHPKLLSDYQSGYFPWRQFMFPAIKNNQVTGEYFNGVWHNIGNPEDLKRAREDANLTSLI